MTGKTFPAPRRNRQTLPPLGGSSHWFVVAAALGLLGILGVAVLDDYGVWPDGPTQRGLGHGTLDLVQGDEVAFREWLGRHFHHLRYYGAAIEAPLALVERTLGQSDSRDIYLTRHLLTHLLFLAAAGAAALLAHRLFGGTWLALFALGAFALHPRLYSHSFFNTKDGAFAALFMVCLALTERAFRRGTAGAFAQLGAGVGVLVNLRVMGVLLFAAALGLLALDAAGRGDRRGRQGPMHIHHAGVFVATAALTLYAVSPYLWPDPSRLVDAFAMLSQHPVSFPTLFAGTVVRWPDIPAHYIPNWIAVTTPPALLALGVSGALAALLQCLRQPGRASSRFGVLLVACPVATVLAIVAANAVVHNGWRHVLFLWGPLAVLATLGLRSLGGTGRRRALRRGLWALAGMGVAASAAQLALLHPHQHTYFNFSVDRDTPERLATWYQTDFARMVHRQAVNEALDMHPTALVRTLKARHGFTFPAAERRRLARGPAADAADLAFTPRNRFEFAPWNTWPFAPAALTLRVYDNTLAVVTAADVSMLDDAPRGAWRAEYRTTAATAPLVRSDYDLHLSPNALTWLKTSCGAAATAGEFTSTAWPADGGVAASFTCDFNACGVRVDGACMVRTPLPPGSSETLKAMTTGQLLRNGPDVWRVAVEFRPSGPTIADVTRAVFPSLPRSSTPLEPPLTSLPADAPFDLYLDGSTLVYARESCRPEDTLSRFFLHVFPNDPSTLPEDRLVSGFHNLDFRMEHHGAALLARRGGRCVAWRRLPGEGGEGIVLLQTGQLDAYGQKLWLAEFAELRQDSLPGP